MAKPCNSDLTPAAYARQLLGDLGYSPDKLTATDERSAASLWAASGAMSLSGHADAQSRFSPAPLAVCAQGTWLALSSINSMLKPDFDAYKLLGERAAIAGYSRAGRVSAGGACRFYQAADGFLALNLAREEDWELIPAWLEQEFDVSQQNYGALATHIEGQTTARLVERGRLLGLAVAPMQAPQPADGWFSALLPSPSQIKGAAPHKPSSSRRRRGSSPGVEFDSVDSHLRENDQLRRNDKKSPLVVDLSSLWAGPLCGQILAQCGARVIKLESLSRTDGARNGPPEFFDLMNTGKESVALDLTSDVGRHQLNALLAEADIVIEASRPRALAQMGIVAAELIKHNPGKVWLSITGYGRQAPMRDWVAYGDDAGVAAGLSWLMGGEQGDPVFCGDAIADPLTGLHGALLAWAKWQQGGGELLDLSLHRVLSYCIAAGTGSESGIGDLPVSEPQARLVQAKAAQLGEHTEQVLAELGLEAADGD